MTPFISDTEEEDDDDEHLDSNKNVKDVTCFGK